VTFETGDGPLFLRRREYLATHEKRHDNRAVDTVQNIFKKVKKSLSAFQIFNKRELAATNRPLQPFKNIFKKVKKKLVSLSNIQ